MSDTPPITPPQRRVTHPSVTRQRVQAAVERDENVGFCLDCGADVEGIEPDARARRCSSCGAHRVYGAEELLIMGVGF